VRSLLLSLKQTILRSSGYDHELRKILLRKLLLIALPCIAISLAACRNSSVSTPRSEEEKVSEKTGENDNSIDRNRSPGEQFDACAQLTREEVEAALGRTFMEPARGSEIVSQKAGTVTNSCMFGSNEGFVSLNIKQHDPTSATAWDAARSYQELKELIFKSRSGGEASATLEDVSGIGMDAFAETKEETANYQTTELRVLSNYSILTVRVVGPAATSTLEAAKTLAGKAILRLEKNEMNAAITTSGPTPTTPRPGASPSDGERPRAPEKSRAEPRPVKEVEPSRPPKDKKAASPQVGKNSLRRADRPNSKESRKSTTRAVNRTKKGGTKAARSNPRSKRRP
jgi:hypothetical protein